jgi:RNA polymerase sigma factor (sigma-70 family)
MSEPAAGPERCADDFDAFYREHLPALTAFILYLGASLADAADVAQEAMTQAYRQWGTIRHPKTWVRRVASRVLTRRMRERRECPTSDIPEPTPLLPAPPATAVWEERHDVLKVIASLPYRQRQILAWTYDGYRPREIAEILDTNAAAVRSSLLGARVALAAHLGLPGSGGADD